MHKTKKKKWNSKTKTTSPQTSQRRAHRHSYTRVEKHSVISLLSLSLPSHLSSHFCHCSLILLVFLLMHIYIYIYIALFSSHFSSHIGVQQTRTPVLTWLREAMVSLMHLARLYILCGSFFSIFYAYFGLSFCFRTHLLSSPLHRVQLVLRSWWGARSVFLHKKKPPRTHTRTGLRVNEWERKVYKEYESREEERKWGKRTAKKKRGKKKCR